MLYARYGVDTSWSKSRCKSPIIPFALLLPPTCSTTVVVLCWKTMTLCSLQHASTHARSRNIVYYQVQQWKTNNKSKSIVLITLPYTYSSPLCPAFSVLFLFASCISPILWSECRSTHSPSSHQSHLSLPIFLCPLLLSY